MNNICQEKKKINLLNKAEGSMEIFHIRDNPIHHYRYE